MKPRTSIPRLSKKKAAEQEGRKVYSTITKRSRVKPKKRSASEFQRIYGSRARVAWIKAQPCEACGIGEPCENAHTRNDGMGRKADARFIVPLCRPCHRELHRLGQHTFAMWHKTDLDVAAAATESRWRAHVGESA